MSKTADRRILGLWPRAGQVAVPGLAIATVLVAIAYFSTRRSDEPSGIFEGGHGGPGHRAGTERWTELDCLEGNYVIESASTTSKVQAVAHAGGPQR